MPYPRIFRSKRVYFRKSLHLGLKMLSLARDIVSPKATRKKLQPKLMQIYNRIIELPSACIGHFQKPKQNYNWLAKREINCLN